MDDSERVTIEIELMRMRITVERVGPKPVPPRVRIAAPAIESSEPRLPIVRGAKEAA